MSRASRTAGLEKTLRALEATFEKRLVGALKACEDGEWGLFGQNAHWRSIAAEELLAGAAEIEEIRSKLVLEKNPMVERFREYRAQRGSNIPGEPKLAAQFLAEITNSKTTRMQQ